MESAPKTLLPTKTSLPKRKKAPSKAPRRLLNKKLRDLERLIKNKNKNSAKDLPEQAIQEAEKKVDEIKGQLKALGPEPLLTETVNKNQKNGKSNNSKAIRYSGTGRYFTLTRWMWSTRYIMEDMT